MFERFTDRARGVLQLAEEEARLLGHPYVGTEHILLGLMAEGRGVAAKALALQGIDPAAVRHKVRETTGYGGGAGADPPPFTPRAKRVLELSLREALQLGHRFIGTEHLLLGLVREGDGVGADVLTALGADLGAVRQQVVRLMSGGTDRVTLDHGEWRSRARSVRAGGPMRHGSWEPSSSGGRCLLCDRDVWGVERFVARNAAARVCEDCVRTAAALIDVATAEHHAIAMPPSVFGQPPEDGSVDAVVAAVSVAFCAAPGPEERAAVVARASVLEPLLRRRTTRLAPTPEGTSVTRIRFLTPDLAMVAAEVVRADGDAACVEARVRRHDGQWMVSEDAVRALLCVPRGVGPASTR